MRTTKEAPLEAPGPDCHWNKEPNHKITILRPRRHPLLLPLGSEKGDLAHRPRQRLDREPRQGLLGVVVVVNGGISMVLLGGHQQLGPCFHLLTTRCVFYKLSYRIVLKGEQ